MVAQDSRHNLEWTALHTRETAKDWDIDETVGKGGFGLSLSTTFWGIPKAIINVIYGSNHWPDRVYL
jgi:hypothetical protein